MGTDEIIIVLKDVRDKIDVVLIIIYNKD